MIKASYCYQALNQIFQVGSAQRSTRKCIMNLCICGGAFVTTSLLEPNYPLTQTVVVSLVLQFALVSTVYFA